MQREIKFRAMAGGVMVYFDLFNVTAVENTLDNKKHIQRIDPPHLFVSNDCPIMQYTGLKDKNGKEIYEGDILDCSTKHLKHIYEVYWNDEQARWAVRGEMYYAENPSLCYCLISAEVIGNIKENPELLTLYNQREGH